MKQNCLNFNEESTVRRIVDIDEVSPLNISEAISNEAIDKILGTI